MNEIITRMLTEAMKALYDLVHVLGYHDLADLKRELTILEQAITMRQGELMQEALNNKKVVK